VPPRPTCALQRLLNDTMTQLATYNLNTPPASPSPLPSTSTPQVVFCCVCAPPSILPHPHTAVIFPHVVNDTSSQAQLGARSRALKKSVDLALKNKHGKGTYLPSRRRGMNREGGAELHRDLVRLSSCLLLHNVLCSHRGSKTSTPTHAALGRHPQASHV
jgi:hypothetical protein